MMRIIYSMIFIGLISCGESNQTEHDNPEINKSSLQVLNIDGTYEYIYPDNTSDLVENQSIVLAGGSGLYYGTSDEFDEAREGYLPGFFVTDMQDVKIIENKITFKLNITPTDLFETPVPLKFKSSSEAKNAGFKQWQIKIRLEKKQYNGIVSGDTLYFKSEIADFDKRFVKKK